MSEKEIKEYKETEERGKNHPDGLTVLVRAAVRFNNYDWMKSSFVQQYHRKRRIGDYGKKKQRKPGDLTDDGEMYVHINEHDECGWFK